MLKIRGLCKHTTKKVPLVDQLRKKKKERKGRKVDGIESNSQHMTKVKTDRKVGLPLAMYVIVCENVVQLAILK